MKQLLLVVLGSLVCSLTGAAERNWPEALRQMPLPPGPPLNRDNAIEVILEGFRSNTTVKALVVLPGVADDFYLIHRDAPKLNLRATNLFQAITVLTNATQVRVIFREPLLLLHVPRDVLQPDCTALDEANVQALKKGNHLSGVHWQDAHWEAVQPLLQKSLRQPVAPIGTSPDAWHFSRHNLAAWGLDDWELLRALSLAGGTKVTVQKRSVLFQVRGTL